MIVGSLASPPQRLDDLLGPALAARLDRLDILSRKVLSGTMPGERRSKRRGRSVEFDDFREYAPGDDLRHVDWNVYARLDRLFVKLFRAEEDLSLTIVVDASGSMQAGDPPKGVYAHRLAFALAYLGLVNQNRVRVALAAGGTGADALRTLAPLRGRPNVRRVGLFLLESLRRGAPAVATGPADTFADAMRRLSGERAARGVCVVLSDFLFDPTRGLDYLAAGVAEGALDVFCVQTLSPGELDPAEEAPRGLFGDLRLTDVETGAARDVTVTPATIEAYRVAMRRSIDGLRGACHARGMAHLLVTTRTPLEELVTSALRRGGLLT
ncbi:MAG: DUF58 domain-containing protein [Planctomycetota bacterium]|nr:DUF58 domain-containing protein [Planctomycetota bacterium]